MPSNSYGWTAPSSGYRQQMQQGMQSRQQGMNQRQNMNMGGQGFAAGDGMGRQRDGQPGDYNGSPNYPPSGGGGRQRDGQPGDYNGGGGQGGWNPGGDTDRILAQWRGEPGSGDGAKDWTNPSFYGDEGKRNMMEGYSSLYAVPQFNAAMANRQQGRNEFQDDRNFGEQARMNREQYGLAERGSNREDLALNYGQQNNVRDFGLNQELGRGGLQLDRDRMNMESGLGYGRLGLDREMGQGDLRLREELGRGQLRNEQGRLGLDQEMGRGDLALRGELGRGGLANDRFSAESQDARNRGMTENERFSNEAQADRFRGMTENERFANQAQADRFGGMTRNEEFANLTGRMGEQNKLTLGQGDLSVRNRDLDLTNAYRQNQLSQEADLTREKFKNELANTRLAATGRIAPQNQRAVRSWY